ncbi:Predicted transcriptional regulator, ArsR family [Microbacterium sp. cf046]|uniref:ArsR family transcriptional regulator n=1 Tax=Microbacterium sp. cf046 TaxID=1761803 RepID=UPI0008EB7BB8|nr:helix-turn-helix domain-containing protein [Microbacterium sp. cf046]SFS16099.1 Predicted transcriptional regulator, ArsR family [Microbacterium sp. cf046]
MSTTRTGYSAISSFSRVEILALVQSRPERTIAELTEATGLHANTVREHLQRLIEAGHVIQSTERRTTRGRPRTLYSAATGDDDASSPIARRKVRDAADRGDIMRRVMPWTGDAVESIGRAATHQLDAIVDNLAESGFDPLVDETGLTIDLSPCPHATAQAGHRQTLCTVHLGLMQAVLAEAGGPLQASCIRSSDRPSDCVVELSMA